MVLVRRDLHEELVSSNGSAGEILTTSVKNGGILGKKRGSSMVLICRILIKIIHTMALLNEKVSNLMPII